MIILGITGAIGHGKSTLAEMLVAAKTKSVHLESFDVIAEVADGLHSKLKTPPQPGDFKALNKWLAELPAVLKKTTHTTTTLRQIEVKREQLSEDPLLYQKLFEHLDRLHAKPEIAKHKITDDNKLTYRPILQWLGGYLAQKVDPEMWYRELVRRASKLDSKHALALVVIGGVRYPSDAAVIKSAGGIVIKIVRPLVPAPDITDPTEREREHIKPDITLVNNGTLRQLEKCAERLAADLIKQKAGTEYYAKKQG